MKKKFVIEIITENNGNYCVIHNQENGKVIRCEMNNLNETMWKLVEEK